MCCLCPLSFPHCDIHKSPHAPYNICPGDTIKRGWFEAPCLIPGQRLLLTTAAKFHLLFFSSVQLLMFTIFFPLKEPRMSLHLLLLSDSAGINHIGGEGQTEPSSRTHFLADRTHFRENQAKTII